MTKETEETNKVPLGLYFLDVLFFFFYINCASVPAKGNTCGRGSIIPSMRPHNLPWYWFATHIPLRPTHEGFCSRGMLQEQRSSVCINDFMGILHPREQNFHPAKCSTIFNRLNVWEQAPAVNWVNLKMLPCVYWHVQNEPGACSGSKTPPVYRPLNKVHINSKTNKETGSNCFKTIVLMIFWGRKT